MSLLANNSYLFLGASQVYGWQGSYSQPAYPFGGYTAQPLLAGRGVVATVDGVPGDCLGGSGCGANFPPNYNGSRVTGFLQRLQHRLLPPAPQVHYDFIVILGGANDIIQETFNNNPVWTNNLNESLYQISELALQYSTNLILLPTYDGPLMSGKCKSQFTNYSSTFQASTAAIAKLYPAGRVTGLPSTPLILNLLEGETTNNKSYYNDDLHLNGQGNYALAQGIVQQFLSITAAKSNTTLSCQRSLSSSLKSNLIDCGFNGITKAQCLATGCCFNSTASSSKPKCFMKT